MSEFISNSKLGVKIRDGIYLFLLFFSLLGYVLAFNSIYSTITSLVLFIYTLLITPSLKFKYSSYQSWGVVVICLSLISSLWSIKPILSYYAVFSFIKLFVFTYSIYRFCYTKENLIKLLKVYILINVILIFFVLTYFGVDILGEGRMSDTENGVNGNGIAISLAFALYSIYLIFYFSRVSFFNRPFYYFLVVLFFVFLVFTGSRTALVMLVLPFTLYLFLKSKYKLVALFSIGILMVGMYYVIMEVPQFYNVLGVRIIEALDIASGNTEGGDSSRLLLFLYGVEWFQDNPFLGIGINNYRVLSNVTPPFVGKNFYAHSNFIEMLVDVGIVGFLVYYSFVFTLLKRAVATFSSNISKLVLALTITIFLHDIISMSYYEWEMHFLICITFVLQSFAEKNKQIKTRKI